MVKRIISVVLAVAMILSFSVSSSAKDITNAQFLFFDDYFTEVDASTGTYSLEYKLKSSITSEQYLSFRHYFFDSNRVICFYAIGFQSTTGGANYGSMSLYSIDPDNIKVTFKNDAYYMSGNLPNSIVRFVVDMNGLLTSISNNAGYEYTIYNNSYDSRFGVFAMWADSPCLFTTYDLKFPLLSDFKTLKINDGFSPPSFDLTVTYQYEDGTPAADPVTQSIESGAAYSVTSPTIPGHAPDKPMVSGTMGDADIAETVTYSPVAPERSTITVNYEYADGSTAAPPFSDSFIEGTAYQIFSPSISGYTPDRPHVSGTVPAEDLTVTVVYSSGTYSLTVNYLYEDNSVAADSFHASYSPGDEYSVSSPTVSGYLPDYRTVSGSMPSRDLTLSVVYHVDYSGGSSSSGGGESSSESPDNPFDPPDDTLNGFFGDYEFHDPFDNGVGGGDSSGFDFDAFFHALLGGYQFTNPFIQN